MNLARREKNNVDGPTSVENDDNNENTESQSEDEDNDQEYIPTNSRKSTKSNKNKTKGKNKGRNKSKGKNKSKNKNKTTRNKSKGKSKAKNDNNIEETTTVAQRTRGAKKKKTVDHDYKDAAGKVIDVDLETLLNFDEKYQFEIFQHVVILPNSSRCTGSVAQFKENNNAVPNSYNVADNTYLVWDKNTTNKRTFSQSHDDDDDDDTSATTPPPRAKRKINSKGDSVTTKNNNKNKSQSLSDNEKEANNRSGRVGQKSNSQQQRHSSTPTTRKAIASFYKDSTTSGKTVRIPIVHHLDPRKDINMKFELDNKINIYYSSTATNNARISCQWVEPPLSAKNKKKQSHKSKHEDRVKKHNVLIGGDKIKTTTGGDIDFNTICVFKSKHDCPDKIAWESERDDKKRTLTRFSGVLFDSIGGLELRYRNNGIVSHEIYMHVLRFTGLRSIKYYCVLINQLWIKFGYNRSKAAGPKDKIVRRLAGLRRSIDKYLLQQYCLRDDFLCDFQTKGKFRSKKSDERLLYTLQSHDPFAGSYNGLQSQNSNTDAVDFVKHFGISKLSFF